MPSALVTVISDGCLWFLILGKGWEAEDIHLIIFMQLYYCPISFHKDIYFINLLSAVILNKNPKLKAENVS